MIGVYNTAEEPPDVFNFYKTNASLTVKSSKSAGKGRDVKVFPLVDETAAIDWATS